MAGEGIVPKIPAFLYSRRHDKPLSLAYQQGCMLCGVASPAISKHLQGVSVWLATFV